MKRFLATLVVWMWSTVCIAFAAPVMGQEEEIISGIAEVNGAKLYYEMKGEGQPLVFIHGGALDRRIWDDQFEVFAKHYKVIRYDVRGHGKSRPPPKPYSDYEDLYHLLRFLNVEKAHLIGLSLGGRIVIDFALEHPEMVETLIPVAPGLSGYIFSAEHLQGMMKFPMRRSFLVSLEIWADLLDLVSEQ